MLDMQSQVLLPYPYPGIHFPSIHLFICNVYLVLLSSAAYSKPLLEQTDSADRADQFQSKRKPSGICSSETYRSNGGSQFQIFPYVFSSFPWHVSKLLCYAKFWVESWILTWITADILQQTQTKPLHRYITCYVSNSRCKTSKKKKRIRNPPPL